MRRADAGDKARAAVERCARAAHAVDRKRKWEVDDPRVQEAYREIARAVIGELLPEAKPAQPSAWEGEHWPSVEGICRSKLWLSDSLLAGGIVLAIEDEDGEDQGEIHLDAQGVYLVITLLRQWQERQRRLPSSQD